MSQRSIPYPDAGYRLYVPEPIWVATIDAMRSYSKSGGSKRWRGSEALIYLGGHTAGEEMMVTTLYRLDHEPQGDAVVVGEEEARWLLRELRSRDEKLVGQVHSHRGLAGHSAGDDQHATSFHSGFISIVVPTFGIGVASIAECAVLEFRAGRFVDLTPVEVAQRIRITPQIARRDSGHETHKSKGSRWTGFVQRLRLIGPKQR